MTWKTYLHGNNKRGNEKIVGLTTKLAQRVGILSKLAKIMTEDQLKNACSGLFTSKLIYCIQIFGNVWGIPSMDEVNRKSTAFTKDDNRKLQVLQNKIMRLKTKKPRETPISELIKATKDMSVQQLTAYHTLMTVHKVITSGYPKYLADKLVLRQQNGDNIFPHRQLNKILVPNVNLTLSRGGFIYRGVCLWNALPSQMRAERKTEIFKNRLREWIRLRVKIKPP